MFLFPISLASMNDKYILVGQTPIPCDDPLEWGKAFGTAERRVCLTRVGPYEVSTVFLGLDHQWGEGPPLLFETMVFRGDNGEAYDYERCSTWLEAEAQHEAVIARIAQPGDKIEQLYPLPPAQTPDIVQA